MKTLTVLVFLLSISVAQASCLSTYYSKNIRVPNQKLTRIGYGTLGVIGAGVVAAYTGGIGAFMPFFGATTGAVFSGVKISANDKRVKALRLVAEARGETAKYMRQLPYFGDRRVIDTDSYFSAELNKKELEKTYTKINKHYQKKYGHSLAMNVFKDAIIHGDENKAFCSTSKKFNSKTIMAYLRSELIGQ
ncbi:MAG: hypothetical protein JNM93_00860 [Bacteriovoracaceae bacterium]|nr:hypothetical protein [Bacteriovoracaceae bacterium]